MNFKDKVVIVTGAGKGIGKEIAIEYAQLGAKVIIAEIDAASGVRVQEAIAQTGGNASFVETDVSNPSAIENLMDIVAKQHSHIDILVNNAGVAKWESPFELSVDEWDHIINTNLRSVFLCTREAAKIMKCHGGGSVVNIASTRATMSEANTEAYAASKGGIIAVTHALAASLGADSIRVNAISPGWIETGDYDSLREIDHKQHLSLRVGKPSDVARACLYLTEEGNDFITGMNLIIDGGMTRKMIYE